ncbi:MAG: hypothetical protein B7Y25_03645 [Alphaproteobacteria bacterium 16-39-46]|nr:MAG: hypothetical protein B7Y25_03645 [Alphaproteobacteria bacterium 16-39-46]OZA43198.1 MAG: hypothetical protein B7X84_03870 [Alphaproteobacteria bacterium 17-39-52]HQS84082.1 MFS transporter [Alphaproteobacteria bacterium]HQS94409.1 MFS transporter [Alphaproteobacteria bacterium]
MTSISEFSQKLLNKYGIKNQEDFYFVLLISGVLCFIAAFVGTFVNLDIHHLANFKGDVASWNFTMPCLGGLLSTLLFPMIREKWLLKDILKVSFIGLFIAFGCEIPLINTYFDFPIRFMVGFFSGILFLEISCFEAELFKAPYRATIFGFVGIEMSLFASLGSSAVDYFQTPFEVFSLSMVGLVICYFLIFMWKDPLGKKGTKTVESSKKTSQSFYQIVAFSPLIFIAIFMMGSIGGGLSSYLAIFFEGTGMTEGHAALAYSFSNLGALVLMPLAGRIGDKWGYEKAFLLTALVGTVATIMAFFFLQKDVLSGLFFMIRGSKEAFISLMYAWIAMQYSGKNLSYGMSSFSLIKSISYIFAPLAVGSLMSLYGNNGFLIWTLVGMSLTFILIIFQIRYTKS